MNHLVTTQPCDLPTGDFPSKRLQLDSCLLNMSFRVPSLGPPFVIVSTVIVFPSAERLLTSLVSIVPLGLSMVDWVMSLSPSQCVFDLLVIPRNPSLVLSFPSVV